MIYRKLVFIQTACVLLAFFSLLVGFSHFAQYPLLGLSRDFIHGGYASLGEWINGTSINEIDRVAFAQELLEDAQPYLDAIMDPEDETFPRLRCPSPIPGRYNYLRRNSTDSSIRPKWFFAINLYQNAHILPRLLGSVVESMRFLGEENCALSIVEGRSDDATLDVLVLLEVEMAKLGMRYFLNTSKLEPLSGDRVSLLADLRNQALEPLVNHPEEFADDTTVVFLNDVAICMEDILELVHQRVEQDADMTCAMDWTYLGIDPSFYDVWVARTMTGDTFFHIPEDGNWKSSWNLFWNNHDLRLRLQNRKPFQVFSCWNGATAFTAAPFVQKQIAFRGPNGEECYQGEPQLFCKDLWRIGYNKIAVVPSINLEYSDEGGKRIKELKGFVSDWMDIDDGSQKIQWDLNPPEQVKCMPSFTNQFWVPWNESF